ENRLRAFTMSKVNDKAVTDDILQELFIKIHSNIDKVRDETKIQSWIFQICRNLITDHFRNNEREMKGAGELIREDAEESEEMMTEALEDMVKMMGNLPPEYCEALCLTELGKMNQKEYAEKSGISYSGAKSRIQRARKMLKDMLMKCCHYEFDKYGTVINIYPAGCCCCHN
ncbi:RNA polymerase sigma factor SigZ, partial [bacterium]|nr:RNA polymerase sigma factor SigZ [bacterium]